MYRKLISRACTLAVGIVVVNALANEFYWYTSIFGFDKVMHTLGGVLIAYIVAAVFLRELIHVESWQMFVALTLAAFVVGLLWEYYEYIVQAFIKSVHLADIPDSIGDLIFDVVGGVIGSLFVIRTKKRYNKVHAR